MKSTFGESEHEKINREPESEGRMSNSFALLGPKNCASVTPTKKKKTAVVAPKFQTQNAKPARRRKNGATKEEQIGWEGKDIPEEIMRNCFILTVRDVQNKWELFRDVKENFASLMLVCKRWSRILCSLATFSRVLTILKPLYPELEEGWQEKRARIVFIKASRLHLDFNGSMDAVRRDIRRKGWTPTDIDDRGPGW